jgi:hypothetical protein
VQTDDISFMEYLAGKSPLPLVDFCEIVQRALELPAFEYDAENESEWGTSIKDGVRYNISRPYEEETLSSWDDTVPEGFNFGLVLIFPKRSQEPAIASADLIRKVGQSLSAALRAPFVHHRTWLGVGNNASRSEWFLPERVDA